MRLCTPLGIWGSVGLSTCFGLAVGHVLIPTKTSRFWNQFSGSVPLRISKFIHMSSASLVKIFRLVSGWRSVMFSYPLKPRDFGTSFRVVFRCVLVSLST
jgi:hypothetical protein